MEAWTRRQPEWQRLEARRTHGSKTSLFSGLKRVLSKKENLKLDHPMPERPSTKATVRSFSVPTRQHCDSQAQMLKLRTLNRRQVGLGPPQPVNNRYRSVSEPVRMSSVATQQKPEIEITLTPFESTTAGPDREITVVAELTYGADQARSRCSRPVEVVLVLDCQSYETTSDLRSAQLALEYLVRILKAVDPAARIILKGTAELHWARELFGIEDVAAALIEHKPNWSLPLFHSLQLATVGAQRYLYSTLHGNATPGFQHIVILSRQQLDMRSSIKSNIPVHTLCTTHDSHELLYADVQRLISLFRKWHEIGFSIVPAAMFDQTVDGQKPLPHRIFSIAPGERRSVAFRLRQGNLVELYDSPERQEECGNAGQENLDETPADNHIAHAPNLQGVDAFDTTPSPRESLERPMLQRVRQKENVINHRQKPSLLEKRIPADSKPAPLSLGRIQSLRLRRYSPRWPLDDRPPGSVSSRIRWWNRELACT